MVDLIDLENNSAAEQLFECEYMEQGLELQKIIPGAHKEWHPVQHILMHTPGDELFSGIVHPKAGLFECPFDPNHAAQEHRTYIQELESSGAKVHNIKDVLLSNLDDPKELSCLKNLASTYLSYKSDHEIKGLNQYKKSVIDKLSPETLADIILSKPTVTLKETKHNTGLSATYSYEPLMNLYFLRDQSITTDKGIVIANMNSEQRAPEIDLIKFIYRKIGIQPIYHVDGDGRMEGGDFIPAGDIAFMGQGLRTNEEAINQLLQNKVFGYERVAVVKDSWHNQDQMHLDTYFNIIGDKKAVLVESRIEAKLEEMVLYADVYKRIGDEYKLESANKEFVSLLKEELDYNIIAVPEEDQLKYGVNFLTISENNIIGVEGVSDLYKQTLANAGVKAKWMNFTNLTCGYGAAHCMTQAFKRGEIIEVRDEL